MTVVWMPEAIEAFNQNLSYLGQEWNDTVALNFITKTEKSISLISSNPHLFAVIDRKKRIYKCNVVRQVSLYYKIRRNQIDLITFWNNYQDPKKLKFK